jgi:hypothetical protein
VVFDAAPLAAQTAPPTGETIALSYTGAPVTRCRLLLGHQKGLLAGLFLQDGSAPLVWAPELELQLRCC